MVTWMEGTDLDPDVLIEHVSESSETDALYDIWQQLTTGAWNAVQALCREASCYLVLDEAPLNKSPIRPHHLHILERVLHGNGQKILAMDLGLAGSTVAATAKQALAALGFECLPSRVPLALVLIGRASNDSARTKQAKVHTFHVSGHRYRIVALERPDRHLETLLPPAEVEVMKARIEGQSHRRIACLRRTSQRTIANQLASASRRLGVSGRLEIIGHLSQQAPRTLC